jgi:hypothetical protein
VFQLSISADSYLDYYRGTVKYVIARSTTGQNVQFPAGLLRQFVTDEGVHGRFALTCDDANEHSRLERLE